MGAGFGAAFGLAFAATAPLGFVREKTNEQLQPLEQIVWPSGVIFSMGSQPLRARRGQSPQLLYVNRGAREERSESAAG